jgi:hypothetical protein
VKFSSASNLYKAAVRDPPATGKLAAQEARRRQPQPNPELPADDADSRRWGRKRILILFPRESASSAGKGFLAIPYPCNPVRQAKLG